MVVGSEQAVSVSRDDVVPSIAEPLRHKAQQSRSSPWPAQRAGDEECRVASAEGARRGGLIVGDHVEGRQFARIPAGTLDDRLANRALQGRKTEHLTTVTAEQELHKATAETAHPVVQNQVRPGGRRRRLHG